MKIFVYGHRHSGTTILRKIIGSHSQIYEFVDEVTIPPATKHKHIVFKYPGLPSYLQNDCTRVNIIKNPWDVFGSLRMRFGDMSDKSYKSILSGYEKHVDHFLKTDDLKIKYEDLFNEDNIIALFDALGFKYEGHKGSGTSISSRHSYIPSMKPESQRDGEDHANYRMWQINQPLKNFTGESAKHLQDNARKIIGQSKVIKKIYDKCDYTI